MSNKIDKVNIVRMDDSDTCIESHDPPCMIGIYAEATISIPLGKNEFILQQIRSGGLYGIDADHEESYLKEIEKEQLADLKYILSKLNVDILDFKTLAEKAEKNKNV